jgi:hypothetical protein
MYAQAGRRIDGAERCDKVQHEYTSPDEDIVPDGRSYHSEDYNGIIPPVYELEVV